MDQERMTAVLEGREPLKLGILHRQMEQRALEIDDDARTVELSFSSEAPVERWFGIEILDHGKRSVDLSRLNNGGPVLVNHDPARHVGVVERAWIDENRMGRALVRFGRSAYAEEIFQDIKDGIRKNTSTGYRVQKIRREAPKNREGGSLEEGAEQFRAVRWMPYEITIAYTGEDPTVGVGRSASADERVVELEGLDEQREGSSAGESAVDQREEPEMENATPNTVTPEELDERLTGERSAERDRVRAILAVGEKFGKTDLARKFIEDGKPASDFQRAILDELAKDADEKMTRSTPAPDNPNTLGLSRRDLGNYSIVRAVRAFVNRNWDEAGLEFECSREIAEKTGHEPKGFYVPLDVIGDNNFFHPGGRSRSVEQMLVRALTVGAGAGAELVAEDHLAGSFIEYLRAATVLGQAGMTVLPGLVGVVDIPRQTGTGATDWVGEGVGATESNLNVDTVQMQPHTVTAEQRMTRRLLLQSSPGIESLVRADLAGAIAVEIDATGLIGDDSADTDRPDGVASTSGIGDVEFGAAGGAPTWTKVVEFESDVATANALMGSLAYITTPKGRGKLKTTSKDTGSGLFLSDGNEMNGYPLLATSSLRDNLAQGGSGNVLTEVFFGNWRDLVLGMWGTFDLKPDEATLAASGGLVLRAFQDVDFAVRHAGSFSYSNDMNAA